jgi:uncharacterized membrane protein YebE (DUF533 family)
MNRAWADEQDHTGLVGHATSAGRAIVARKARKWKRRLLVLGLLVALLVVAGVCAYRGMYDATRDFWAAKEQQAAGLVQPITDAGSGAIQWVTGVPGQVQQFGEHARELVSGGGS